MTSKNTKHYIFFIIVFFALTNIAHASFEITEIMYDQQGSDTNREWVEVKNTGSIPDDLSRWFLFSGNSKHRLAPQNTFLVPASGYAVIVQDIPQFNLDYPNFKGILFDSSWTGFNNKSGTISLKDANLNIVSPVSYTSAMGGAGDGNSLSKIDNIWQEGTPTPGMDNIKIIPKVVAEKPAENPVQKNSPVVSPKTKTVLPATVPQNNSSQNKKQIINLNDLGASANNSGTNISNSTYTAIGLILVIGLGIISFLIIKKRNKNSDYIEKEIRAEDMTIIE
jgi:hypothetical protein